ncbi:MAG: hypothetical protein BWK73_42435 [Thiothrix lacustris]|uniref:Uncharacterized protein n=1 Tax=Thiothrix lacustris TaxID=525917 RepID=A0A1Y1QCB4_9GAMM|nr:MAG: hypothetical protein BWK73_42435 [Thiothrix lacustris]
MTNMTIEITEQVVVKVVKQGMDQSVMSLDWQTQAALTRLRVQSLAQLDRRSVGFRFSSLSRGFAVLTAVTLAVTLWVLPTLTEMPSRPLLSTTELDVNAMDVLMSGEDMDLLENLDMYEWLEAEYG